MEGFSYTGFRHSAVIIIQNYCLIMIAITLKPAQAKACLTENNELLTTLLYTLVLIPVVLHIYIM